MMISKANRNTRRRLPSRLLRGVAGRGEGRSNLKRTRARQHFVNEWHERWRERNLYAPDRHPDGWVLGPGAGE